MNGIFNFRIFSADLSLSKFSNKYAALKKCEAMAIYHLDTKHVKRSDARSAVAAAAYRAGQKLKNDRDGKTHDYRRKSQVVHAEIILPAGVKVGAWAKDREMLWNMAEKTETRKNSRTAREIEVSIPVELNEEQYLELVREYAQYLSDRYGVAADFAIHAPDGNPHAHILMTTRTLTEDGLGKKSEFEMSDKQLRDRGLPVGKQQVEDVREQWELIANRHLALAGLDVRIDRRSHAARGLEIVPTRPVGVHAVNIKRNGKDIYREKLNGEERKHNKESIFKNPEQILEMITTEKSVFTHRDVARYIHRCVSDEDFQSVYAKVMASSELVELKAESADKVGLKIPAKYSTVEMIDIERNMVASASRLNEEEHKLPVSQVEKAIANLNESFESIGGSLSEEQSEAIRHITGSTRISALVGHAGAGKSTVLSAARNAWESKGYRVIGGALAGKAADGLQKSSGIRSRTLASLEYSLKHGYESLSKNDVLVIDETGMVDSRQLGRIISKVEESGAKLVLVGDPNQLQPIGAGAAFRACVNEIGCSNLSGIRRQKKDWQKEASGWLASGQVKLALQAYEKFGSIQFAPAEIHTIKELTKDYLADLTKNRNQTRLALAHRREDRKMLNASIRTAMQIEGYLAWPSSEGEVLYQTDDGVKAFSKGERIVFLENNSELGVKNGMLATIEKIRADGLEVALDDGGKVAVPKTYQCIDYGYATTIHKSQGATVDRTFVLASATMDRHLAYVALSRHREDTKMYASERDFISSHELCSKLSRDRGKETTLDYLNAFSGFRGLEPKVKQEKSPKQTKLKQTKLDRFLDYFCHAVEERLWFEFHEMPFIGQKFGDALNKADFIKLRLGAVLLGMVHSASGPVKKWILKLSGQDRVDAIKTQIDKAYGMEQPLRKELRQDTRRKTDEREPPSPELSPGF